MKTTMTAIAAALALCSTAALADTITHDDFRRTVQFDSFDNTLINKPSDVLRRNATRYGLPLSLNNLTLVQVQESLLGKHYRYQQMHQGLAIDQAEIVVSMDHNGRVLKVFNNSVPVNAAFAKTNNKATLSADDALDRAWKNQRVQQALVDTPRHQLVWVANESGLTLAYRVHIAAQMPTGGFVQYINANNGDLLKSYTTTLPRNAEHERTLADRQKVSGALLDRHAAMQEVRAKQTQKIVNAAAASGINGSGNVFDPDPRTVLNNDSLTDTSSAASFDAAYAVKSLRDLTVSGSTYSLSGPYINIKNIEAPNTAPSTTTTGVWTAKRGSNAFNDSNTYFHIDQNQRYMQSLGFTGTKGIIERPLDVDTDGLNGDDNSHYSYGGSTDYLAFGHGCVDDNEDADVILHEYGHGIQHNINSSWSGGDTGAMGEGFGDYWAGSYSYSTPNGQTYHPEWAFSWDGHGACWGGRVMNKTTAMYNSSKTYSAHQSVTENGVTFQSDELWSTPLFQSLVSLMAAGKPRANVDKIILEAHFGLGANVKMPVMAQAIVDAAKKLFPSDLTYATTFQSKFEAQKILSGSTTPPPGGTMNETESNNSRTTANTVSTSGTTVNGSISSSSDTDYFKVTVAAGKTFQAVLTPNSSADFDLYLYNSSGTQVAKSTNGTGAIDTASTKNTSTTSKVYYARVTRYSGTGTYTLKLTF